MMEVELSLRVIMCVDGLRAGAMVRIVFLLFIVCKTLGVHNEECQKR